MDDEKEERRLAQLEAGSKDAPTANIRRKSVGSKLNLGHRVI